MVSIARTVNGSRGRLSRTVCAVWHEDQAMDQAMAVFAGVMGRRRKHDGDVRADRPVDGSRPDVGSLRPQRWPGRREEVGAAQAVAPVGRACRWPAPRAVIAPGRMRYIVRAVAAHAWL